MTKNEGVTPLCRGQSLPVSTANYISHNNNKKKTRLFPVAFGAESPWLLRATDTSIGSWLAVGDCLHPIKQVRKKVAEPAADMDTADQVRRAANSKMILTQTWVWFSVKLANVPLIDDRNEKAFILTSSLCVLMQLASVGTFQVLKLPLGFIRVLEWVSWNLNVFECSNFNMQCKYMSELCNIKEDVSGLCERRCYEHSSGFVLIDSRFSLINFITSVGFWKLNSGVRVARVLTRNYLGYDPFHSD